MPVTPTRSNAYTPPPSSGDGGIMLDLYRISVGPLNATYYQQQFQRFETLGKAVPAWNHAAAFFTLAWLVLHKLWRPAGIYAGVWLATVLLWAFGWHARVPVQVEATLCVLAALLLCAVPGFLGNGWFYRHVRQQTLATLTSASSLAEARALLAQNGASPRRLQTIAAVQAALGVALAALIYSYWGHATAPAPTASAARSGPPHLVIPAVASLPLLAPGAPTQTEQAKAEPPAAPSDTALPPAPAAPVEAAPASTPNLADSTVLALSTAEAEAEPAPVVRTAAPAAALVATTTAASTDALPIAKNIAKKTAPPPTPTPVSTKTKAAAIPEPVAQPLPGRLVPGKYYLNAGVYAQASNVERSVKQLRAAKLPSVRQTVSSSKGDLTRLRIGPFDTRKQAEQAAVTARKLRIETSVFQQPKK